MFDLSSIETLLENGESQTIEFKTSFGREAIETLVAFANAQGGTVLIGVSDDGFVRGTTVGKETLNDWLGQVKSVTSPSIIPDIEEVQVDDKWVVSIHIAEYPVKPVNTRGKYFKRIATSNHQLNLTEITDLHMQSLQLSWDAYPANGVDLNELDINKIDHFIERVNESGRFNLAGERFECLQKLNLIKNNQPTNAAKLLFTPNQTLYNIHVGRFKTPSMILDDKMIRATLYEAVEETMLYILSHIKVAFEFTGEVQRTEILEYPQAALRELVLNAIVHRDYSSPVDIQIKIFDQAITIFNPGKLYGDITIDKLKTDHYQSRTRNKLIAEVFYLTKDIEKYGSGFIRVREAVKQYATMKFDYEENGDGFFVTLSYSEQKITQVTLPIPPPITPPIPPRLQSWK